MSRNFASLLLLLLSTESSALKGVRSRQLQGWDESTTVAPVDGAVPKGPLADDLFLPKGGPKDVTIVPTDDKKATKDDKKTTKDDKKGKKDKKDKKDKKCKKRNEKKKGEPEVVDIESTSIAPAASPDEPNEESAIALRDATLPTPVAEVLWCEDESIMKDGDCKSLAEGILPSDADTVDGFLSIELTAKENDTVAEMQRILTEETSLAAVGCSRRRLDGNATDMGNTTEETISLLAYGLGDLSPSSIECVNSGLEGSGNCSVLTSDIKVYYEGNATEEQKVALFDSLTNTFQSQIAAGRFSEVASVHFAEASLDANGNNDNASKNKGVSSPGGIAGLAVGSLVVVAAVGAGVYVYKKRNGDGEVFPSHNNPVMG